MNEKEELEEREKNIDYICLMEEDINRLHEERKGLEEEAKRYEKKITELKNQLKTE